MTIRKVESDPSFPLTPVFLPQERSGLRRSYGGYAKSVATKSAPTSAVAAYAAPTGAARGWRVRGKPRTYKRAKSVADRVRSYKSLALLSCGQQKTALRRFLFCSVALRCGWRPHGDSNPGVHRERVVS